jgi:arylsulfatase A-like enzyme
MFDFTVNDDGVLRTYGHAAEDYQTDVLAAEAESVLRAWTATEEPFFLSIAPLAPHGELPHANGAGKLPRPAPRHAGRFAHEPLPAKPSINEAEMSDKPPHLAGLRALSAADMETIEARYRARLRSLLAVDDLVARVVGVLEETGQLDRTVLLFTSDNGFFLGEHRIREGKILPYEEAIRVPLLVRGGGFPAGKKVDQPVSNVDLAATIVALTGAVPGLELDGRSLLPVALNPRSGRGRILLLEGRRTSPVRPTFEAVRSGRYLWVEYAYGGRELYDLNLDPYQLENRAGAQAYAEVEADLVRRLARLRTCRGKECR